LRIRWPEIFLRVFVAGAAIFAAGCKSVFGKELVQCCQTVRWKIKEEEREIRVRVGIEGIYNSDHIND